MPDALLPCPFCADGGKPDKPAYKVIMCRVCGANAPIDVWNQRPTPPGALELARKIAVPESDMDFAHTAVGWKQVAQQLARALLIRRPQESADLSAAQDLAMHVSFDPVWLAHNVDHIKRLVEAVLRLSAEGGERE